MRITLEDVCQSFAVKGKNEIIAYTFQNKKGQSFAVKDFFLKLYTFQKKKKHLKLTQIHNQAHE